MKKTLLCAFILLIAICIFSCGKDPEPNNGNNEQPTDTIPNVNDSIPSVIDTIPSGIDTIPTVIDRIYFGDTTGMIVTGYDHTLAYNEMWNPIIIDLNNDGTDDIKIGTYFDGPMMINVQTLTLYCLTNKVKLLGETVEKESYIHKRTTYGLTLNYNLDTVVSATSEYIYSTCDKIADDDQVNTSSVFEVTAGDYDEEFSKDDNFKSTDIVLFREDINYPTMWSHETEDTIFLSHQNYIYHCWNFPTDMEKYIGFKFTKNGESRLGWLKIELIATSGVANTRLIETAIQK